MPAQEIDLKDEKIPTAGISHGRELFAQLK